MKKLKSKKITNINQKTLEKKKKKDIEKRNVNVVVRETHTGIETRKERSIELKKGTVKEINIAKENTGIKREKGTIGHEIEKRKKIAIERKTTTGKGTTIEGAIDTIKFALYNFISFINNIQLLYTPIEP